MKPSETETDTSLTKEQRAATPLKKGLDVQVVRIRSDLEDKKAQFDSGKHEPKSTNRKIGTFLLMGNLSIWDQETDLYKL